jgi:protein subunit release factor B
MVQRGLSSESRAARSVHASASDERYHHRNKRLALARLSRKLEDRNHRERGEAGRTHWRAHRALQRGNPVQIFREN